MPFNAYAVAQTTIGLAKETTKGTPVAPVYWAKVKAPKYKPNLTVIEDDTLQGSMVVVYNQVPGMRYDGHGWDSYPYMDIFPLYVECELGSTDGVTAAPTNTTTSGGSNTAGSTTLTTTAALANNSWVVVGTGATMETHYVTSIVSTVATLQYPLLYTQAPGTAVTGLTSHVFSLLNNAGANGDQPPSLTISDFDGEEWRQLAAAQMDKLTIKGNDQGFVDFTVDFLANAAITPSNPTPSFTAPTAPPGWTTLISIGGTQVLYVEDWELDLARGTKPVPGLTGTQAFPLYFAGPLTSTGKITVVEQSGAPEITKYLNGSQQSLDITISDRASGWGCRFHSSLAAFKTGEIVRGKDWVEATLDIQLLPTATDATAGGVSPINVSIGNGQTAAY